MRRVLQVLLVLQVLQVLPSATAEAVALQASQASISGVVKDASGASVPGVVVEAVVAGRSIASVTTGVEGRFQLGVPEGVPFELKARGDGFADQVVAVPGLKAPLTRDLAMAIGGISDTLVVTASRGLESRATLTQSVTVATRAEIDALGSRSLADVMRYVPGVNLEAAGREGAVTSMFSRGGESDYNLVLIDGVRVNQSGGTFDFSRIDSAEIERVEVVRGAQSSLWGSDAMGAVVQIFTNRAGATDRPQLAGEVEGGSFHAFRGGARVSGGAKQSLDYQAGVARRSTDGAFADLLREADEFEQTTYDAGVGAAIGARASIRGGLRYSDGGGRSVGPIAFGARDTGGVYDTKDVSGHVDVNHTIGNRFAATASFNYFNYQSVSNDTIGDPPFGTYAILEGTPNAIFPNGTRLVRFVAVDEYSALVAAGAMPAPGQFLASRQSSDFPFTSATEFRRPAFRYQGDYAWGSGQRLSAGYDWERERNPLTAGFALTNNAVFIQQQFSAGERFFATVGGRVDSKESYDTFFSPKLSAGGYLVPLRNGGVSSMKIFGNLGRGIKSPTFTERFGGSFADASPDLRVERARTGDLGVEATFADQRLRALVTYFNNHYVDQIAFRSGPVGDGIPEYINIDGSKADGVEFELGLQRPIAGFSAVATYAYVDHQVVTNLSTSQQFQPGQPLLRRPRNSGAVRASYLIGRASAYVNVRVVGDRHDNSFLSLRTVPNAARPTAITTDITFNPGYTVTSVGCDVRVHDTVTVFVMSDNVADTEYQGALGYPGLPRSVTAGARFNIGRR